MSDEVILREKAREAARESDRITPAEHVIVSGGIVVRKEHRCAACGAVFWMRADGELNVPRA